jgi:hypothetical protein
MDIMTEQGFPFALLCGLCGFFLNRQGRKERKENSPTLLRQRKE